MKQSRTQSLVEKYSIRGTLIPGGELRMERKDALLFLQDCRNLGLIILGLDFYRVRSNGTQQVTSTAWSPEWEKIVHSHHASEGTTEAARKLIENGLPDDATLVSFVLAEG